MHVPKFTDAIIRFFSGIPLGSTFEVLYHGGGSYHLSGELDTLKFKPTELDSDYAPLMLWTYAHSKDKPVGQFYLSRIKMDYTDTMWCEKGIVYPLIIGNELTIHNFFTHNAAGLASWPNQVRTMLQAKHICALTDLGMKKDLEYGIHGAYNRISLFFMNTLSKRLDKEVKNAVQTCFTHNTIVHHIFSFLLGLPIREKDVLSLIQTTPLDIEWRLNGGWIEVHQGKGKRKRWEKIKKISSYGGSYASDEEY